MTSLTRRRSDSSHQETWHIYFGDVHVGTIGTRAGVPLEVDQWAWSCGFYPGLEPGQHTNGSAETFEAARTDCEVAWVELLPAVPVGALEEWRRNRDWHAWKHRMWDTHCLLPTQTKNDRSRCFCGVGIINASINDHIITAHRGIGA